MSSHQANEDDFTNKGRGKFFCLCFFLILVLVLTAPSFALNIVSRSVRIKLAMGAVSPDKNIKVSKELIAEDGTEAMTLADSVSYMTSEQKALLKTLKVSPLVTDLAGIEEFTNLESLDLTEAFGLVSVDISGNSSIKFLNAKDSPNLEVLDCSNCGLLELNIEGCKRLRVLKCNNNSLRKLDVRTLTSLEVLECFNQILDCSENVTDLKAWNIEGDSYESVKISYDYITGFNEIKMDVTIFTNLLKP